MATLESTIQNMTEVTSDEFHKILQSESPYAHPYPNNDTFTSWITPSQHVAGVTTPGWKNVGQAPKQCFVDTKLYKQARGKMLVQ